MLMFNTGPLTGTLLGNKATIGAKTAERANHPYTFVGMGGQIASEIKFAGYDHVAIKGRAAKPVYLLLSIMTPWRSGMHHISGASIPMKRSAGSVRNWKTRISRLPA